MVDVGRTTGVARKRKTRIAAGLAALLVLSAPSVAISGRPLFQKGALCRDMKGLAKPCAPGEAARQGSGPEVPEAATADSVAPVAQPDGPSPQDAASPGRETAARQGSAKRSLFRRGQLCRDSKGLAKPCP